MVLEVECESYGRVNDRAFAGRDYPECFRERSLLRLEIKIAATRASRCAGRPASHRPEQTVPQVLVQQIFLAVATLALLAGAITLIRRRRLTFAGGILWVGISALGLLGAALLPTIDIVGDIIGVAPAAVFTGIASVLLGLIALLLSLQVSSLEHTLQDTVEAIGIAGVNPALQPDSRNEILAIVPAFNEARSLGDVVKGLIALGLPVLVVNDGSRDETAEVARMSGASVLNLPANLGVGGALRAGLRYAQRQGFSAVVQCDGDGQHPAEAVKALLDQQSPEYDLLIGSRFVESYRSIDGLGRRFAIASLARLASRSAQTRISDSTSGLRLMRRPLLDEVATHIPRHYLGDTFEIVIAATRSGYRVAEIPVAMKARRFGISTASPASAIGLTLRVLLAATLRIQRPFTPPERGPLR